MSLVVPIHTPLLGAPPLDLPMKLRTIGGVFGVRRRTDATLPSPLQPSPSANATYKQIYSHEGVDLLQTAGERVYATNHGTVIDVTQLAGDPERKAIVIDHHPVGLGIVTIYRNLRNTFYTIGQRVKMGAIIGILGRPSTFTIDHLHFEIRRVINSSSNSRWDDLASIPFDPTRELYNWEDRTTPRPSVKGPHPLEEISVVNWNNIEMFQVKWNNRFRRIPLYEPTPAELERVQILRDAYHHGHSVYLATRTSEFFSKIDLITAVRCR